MRLRPSPMPSRAIAPWRQTPPSGVAVRAKGGLNVLAVPAAAEVVVAGVAVAEGARARDRDAGSAARSRALAHGAAQRAHRALGAHARSTVGRVRRVGAFSIAPRA